MELFTQFFYNDYIQSIVKILLIIILSGIIGLERDSWNKPAGFRTHALVGISSVLVVLCGEYFYNIYNIGDPTRIPAQLLSGIGFIGAGTILRDGFNVKGLTTAASLLAVTCIGLCIGAGFYFIGITATVISYLVLSYSYLLTDKLDHFINADLAIFYQNDKDTIIKKLETFFNSKNIIIKKIDFSKKQENKNDNNKETTTNENNSIESTINKNNTDEITITEHNTTEISTNDVEQMILFHIKYDHNIKLTSILTTISTIENVLKVEAI